MPVSVLEGVGVGEGVPVGVPVGVDVGVVDGVVGGVGEGVLVGVGVGVMDGLNVGVIVGVGLGVLGQKAMARPPVRTCAPVPDGGNGCGADVRWRSACRDAPRSCYPPLTPPKGTWPANPQHMKRAVTIGGVYDFGEGGRTGLRYGGGDAIRPCLPIFGDPTPGRGGGGVPVPMLTGTATHAFQKRHLRRLRSLRLRNFSWGGGTTSRIGVCAGRWAGGGGGH